jgi:hypothetical protein
MKNAVFWDVALCRSCLNRCFGGTYSLHLQGRKSESEESAYGATSQKTAFFKKTLHSQFVMRSNGPIYDTIIKCMLQCKPIL